MCLVINGYRVEGTSYKLAPAGELTKRGLYTSKEISMNALPLPASRSGNARFLAEGTSEGVEGVFHSKHDKYTQWIKEGLDEILEHHGGVITDANANDVLNDLIKLTDAAKDHISDAWMKSDKSMNEYFHALLANDNIFILK
jgi:hypothetical protein